MATRAKRAPGEVAPKALLVEAAKSNSPRQLELDLLSTERPERPRRRRGASPGATLGSRLALSPDEAAAVLGVSRDYFDEHVIAELRVVRRGRRIIIALAELERWLDRAATRISVDRRTGSLRA